MSLTFIGQKKGMMQLFDAEGQLVPCTIIAVEPNTIVRIKDRETEGYDALQIGALKMTKAQAFRAAKPLRSYYTKLGIEPLRVLHESRVSDTSSYQVGQTLDLTHFADVKYVDVEGVSKGKGYQGVMKLHGMAGGPGAHGSGFHRKHGSTGMRSTPGRCFPGGRRASRMGGDHMTVQNLKVVAIHGNHLLVMGAVPGAPGAVVHVTAAKKRHQQQKKG